MIVGTNTADDAAVYRIDRNRALVQTVDFFTPIVDDPFTYGQIAATNSLSDVYAMGGRPLTALNILGVPTDKISSAVISEILRGGGEKAREARCSIVGGHTIQNPEPIYGLSVTGLVSIKRVLTNAAARPGDLLVLTKPLGTGIVTTGIKRKLTSRALEKKTIAVMTQLNSPGAVLAEKGLVRAAVDVTGFGLLGHLGSMCRESKVGATLYANRIPAIDQQVFDLIKADCIPGGSNRNLEFANEFTGWNNVSTAHKVLFSDAQTSGGLLLCVPEKNLSKVEALLQKQKALCAAVIGEIVESNRSQIWVHP
ncbi:MAG: Selenide, water dikinase [Verrucomicrobiales bacterium]|nr:Selenide, water dikinase [Verrucomicrobiales bacterium]